eukprot:g11141.t1
MAAIEAQLPCIPQAKMQSDKKDKSPKKVLLRKSEAAAFSQDMEHFATISAPPGLDKRDDEFSDTLWSRSTTGGSGSAFESPDEDEEPKPIDFAKLSSLQYKEAPELAAYYHMIAASLLQSTQQE